MEPAAPSNAAEKAALAARAPAATNRAAVVITAGVAKAATAAVARVTAVAVGAAVAAASTAAVVAAPVRLPRVAKAAAVAEAAARRSSRKARRTLKTSAVQRRQATARSLFPGSHRDSGFPRGQSKRAKFVGRVGEGVAFGSDEKKAHDAFPLRHCKRGAAVAADARA